MSNKPHWVSAQFVFSPLLLQEKEQKLTKKLNLAVKFTLSLGCITNCWLKSVPEVKIQLFSHVFLDENLLSLSCSWPNVLMREKN